MQALGESLSQPVRQRLSHDRVVVVVVGAVRLTELFQSDPACHCKRAYMITQSCFPWRNKIGEAATWLVSFFICLLPKKMKSFAHSVAIFVGIQLNVISCRVCGEDPVHASRCDQPLLNNHIEKSIAFFKYLSCLGTMFLI